MIIFPEDGLTRRQVADDPGVGLSTLNKWVTAHRDTDVVSVGDRELARENERFRCENRILNEERGILNKGRPFSAIGPGTMVEPVLRAPKAVMFRFVAEQRGAFPIPDHFLILLTFFKTIKAEMIWRRSWKTRRQAEMAIFEYTNRLYNPRRRHSALGWKSPVAFERKVA